MLRAKQRRALSRAVSLSLSTDYIPTCFEKWRRGWWHVRTARMCGLRKETGLWSRSWTFRLFSHKSTTTLNSTASVTNPVLANFLTVFATTSQWLIVIRLTLRGFLRVWSHNNVNGLSILHYMIVYLELRFIQSNNVSYCSNFGYSTLQYGFSKISSSAIVTSLQWILRLRVNYYLII